MADKMVKLPLVFHMDGANEFQTAFQVAKEPQGAYVVHLMDFATRKATMGFLSRAEMIELRDALNRELGS